MSTQGHAISAVNTNIDGVTANINLPLLGIRQTYTLLKKNLLIRSDGPSKPSHPAHLILSSASSAQNTWIRVYYRQKHTDVPSLMPDYNNVVIGLSVIMHCSAAC
jgi:hypothetical protein